MRRAILGGVVAAMLIAVIVGGIASCQTVTLPLDPVTPLTVEQRDAIINSLNETLAANKLAQLNPGEPRAICSNYERAAWDIDTVLDPLFEAGWDNADAFRDFHNHSTLLAILHTQSDSSVKERFDLARSVELIRAFCGSLE